MNKEKLKLSPSVAVSGNLGGLFLEEKYRKFF